MPLKRFILRISYYTLNLWGYMLNIGVYVKHTEFFPYIQILPTY